MNVQSILSSLLTRRTDASGCAADELRSTASSRLGADPIEARDRLLGLGALDAGACEHFDALLDRLAGWGEAQDLTWIE